MYRGATFLARITTVLVVPAVGRWFGTGEGDRSMFPRLVITGKSEDRHQNKHNTFWRYKPNWSKSPLSLSDVVSK